jgi:tetratricopeptide (TPR) repeat protein
VRLALWDGQVQNASPGDPIATVRIHDRATLLRLLYRMDLAFGEAYTIGRLEVEGDLVGMLTAVTRTFESRQRLVRRVPWNRRRGASVSRATRNARYHYDLGNDFYRQWLDPELVYSCAYFARPEMSAAHGYLSTALARKGMLTDAIQEMREVVRLDPKSAEAHYNLGDLYAKNGQMQDAIGEYREAQKMDPGYARTRMEKELQ